MTKQLYKEQFSVLTRMINEWDPYGLMTEGAPEDEFSEEVARILPKLSKAKGHYEVAQIVFNVFSENFSTCDFILEKCEPVADEIFSYWKERSWIEK